MRWYKAQFPLKIRLKLANSITGEATPYYMFHPHAIDRIKKAIPKVKIIVLLRNPIDRAYSHYNFMKRRGKEIRDFEEAIREEEDLVEKELEKLTQDSNYKSSSYQDFTYISRGIYYNQLIKVQDLFDSNQILIIKSEDLFQKTEQTVNQTLEFLNLQEIKLEEYRTYQEGKYDSLDINLREELKNFYEPWNKKLERLINRKLEWN